MCHNRSWTEQIWVSSCITCLDEHPLKQVKICTNFFFVAEFPIQKQPKIPMLNHFTNFFGTFSCHVMHHNSWWTFYQWTFGITHHRLWTSGSKGTVVATILSNLNIWHIYMYYGILNWEGRIRNVRWSMEHIDRTVIGAGKVAANFGIYLCNFQLYCNLN